MSENVAHADLLVELRGAVCRCGAPKLRMQTFCRRCYFRLRPSLRLALYRRIGEGYEQAYGAAVEHLRGEQAP